MQTARTCFEIMLISTAALLLSGCWASASGILIPREERAQPVKSGVYRYHSDGDVQDIILTKLPGGGYSWEDPVEDGVILVFASQIRPEWYALQMIGTDSEDNLLGIARAQANSFEIFDPDCNEEIAAIDGVERARSDCVFSTHEALVFAAELAVKNQSLEMTGWLELGQD
jgi:hypothetical protein